MQAVYISIILVSICTSSECASETQSQKSYNSKFKDQGTKCGISATAANGGRIVGGDEATPHSWPWQAFIRCKHADRGVLKDSYCGGSIISDKWVITAAHCVHPEKTDIRRNCKLFLGIHNLQRNESTQLIANIADYFIHEKYDRVNNNNGYDLSLYKLAQPLQFTDAINPICLPFGLPELPHNKACYATGWGRTRYNISSQSAALMQLPMTVQKDLYCKHTNPRRDIGLIICTGQWNRNKDVCNGDSGGPLACQEPDRKWYLRAVLSTGSTKCNSVATYIKVAAFEAWIKKITSRN